MFMNHTENEFYLAASHIASFAQLDLVPSSFSIEFRNPRNIE